MATDVTVQTSTNGTEVTPEYAVVEVTDADGDGLRISVVPRGLLIQPRQGYAVMVYGSDMAALLAVIAEWVDETMLEEGV